MAIGASVRPGEALPLLDLCNSGIGLDQDSQSNQHAGTDKNHRPP